MTTGSNATDMLAQTLTGPAENVLAELLALVAGFESTSDRRRSQLEDADDVHPSVLAEAVAASDAGAELRRTVQEAVYAYLKSTSDPVCSGDDEDGYPVRCGGGCWHAPERYDVVCQTYRFRLFGDEDRGVYGALS